MEGVEKIEAVERLVKKCISVNSTVGIPENLINDQYRTFVGEYVPYQRCGFASLYDFLINIHGIEMYVENGTEFFKINWHKELHNDIKDCLEFKNNFTYKDNIMWNTNHPVKLYGPVFQGYQFISDDYLLQLVIENSPLPISKRKDHHTLYCGLCVSGQTILRCVCSVKNSRRIANRVIIQLGSVDIYNVLSIV
ncbi:uncharacterized protein LOC105207466 isoform X2 [Solenopsis invicta]|uniref:uncharacterized protein LOC105207466 isoform X2 n=1 Tax=Solenopsis invicta TaxID=13686 RepID=UPI00193CEE78|nr:uncharacterized protein LOC105207466 isoform X2 [Solenopsis invicta]